MYCNNNKKYKCFTAILYVCLLNIVINNVSLSNEDIISKQEFQKLLDIKHITSLKKISETVFELMFNTNDDKEEARPASTDASMKENKGSNEGTTGEIVGDGREERVKIIDGDRLNKISDASTLKLVDTLRKMNAYLNIHSECLVKTFQLVVDIMCKIKENEDLFKIIREKYLKTDTVHNQNLIDQNDFETFSCQRNEANKQNNKEIGVYQTQMIQMFKDLIENVNKLNNKVDRLESVVSQKIDIINKQENSEASGKSGIVRATKVNMEDFRILGAGLGDSVSEDTQAEEAEEK